MKNFFCFAFIVTAFCFFCACAKTARYSPEEIKDYPPEIQERINEGAVMIGMTSLQVRYAWGSPATIHILSPSEDGKPREEWIYSKLGVFMDKRLLFVDGKLTDIFPEPKNIKQQGKE
ncbi:MAG: hypothetical protein ABSA46_01395 [Thermodesulfovibrionales bacterium]|jgi:hypothetical protein